MSRPNMLGNSNQTPILRLYRFGKDKDGFEMGHLTVSNGALLRIFTTRERGHNYVSLRIGSYEMKHSTKTRGEGFVYCLRPTNSKISSILIHDAYKDKPNTLTGCIAPGFPYGEENWGESAQAMTLLWNILGKWEKDKKVILQVMSNVSYVSPEQNRDDWERLR